MNYPYQCKLRLPVVVGIMAMLVGGCQRVPPAPLAEDRTMTYDLLAETGHLGVGRVLLTLVDDSVSLRLDSAEVFGLDAAIKTWQAVGTGGGITVVRHRIIGSLQEQKMITDTGIVQITVGSRDKKAPHDSLLAFKGIWNASRGGWRLRYQEIKPLPPPEVK